MFPKLEKAGIDLDALVEGIEKKYLLEALQLTNGAKTEAAKMLNLSFRSCHTLINRNQNCKNKIIIT
jgi:DNA-binding NtrC family response regulator